MANRTSFVASIALGFAFFLQGAGAGAQDNERNDAGDRNDDANETNARNANDGQRQVALPPVRADSPSGVFGGAGQLAISSDAGFSLSNTSLSEADGSATALIMRPAVDYFVVDNLSLGGFLGLEYNTAPGGSSTAMSIGPRVGYNLPFGARWSAWPKLGFSFASTSQKVDDTTLPTGEVVEGRDETSTSLQLNIFAPVMFHPVEHFFLGLGPAFDLDLTGDNKATTIAVRLTLGGWF